LNFITIIMKTRSSKLSKATRKQLAAVRARRETVQIWNLLFALLAVLLILASLAMLLDWVIASRGSLLRVATSLSVHLREMGVAAATH
jgi:fatty acid desaturase